MISKWESLMSAATQTAKQQKDGTGQSTIHL